MSEDVTQVTAEILPFRWRNADGLDENKGEWFSLIELYKELSHDHLTSKELFAELKATIREQGAVFVALDGDRHLAGYMCVRVMASTSDRYAFITQWYRRPDSRDLAVGINDAFVQLAKDFARGAQCQTVRFETRRVLGDGAVSSAFLKSLQRYGFRPIYSGLVADIEGKDEDHAAV